MLEYKVCFMYSSFIMYCFYSTLDESESIENIILVNLNRALIYRYVLK
jgi:hypothetical protein